eukprot:CAMPEP_0202480144 /NCGR_PEP_ID=MMETSP1361-20130828/249_1 /ASSEMBLY_ACC=CAM_ASM_000849 /TAXON_ID=210615 /ORGANISM="Staurosira complex sp., Strain CCMP2646" /LENGTH=191 /DNA_ID=CAMNT_0049107549 /DNA_START=79 /DNA_END=654 /DNA_ORIENTATION=+
MPKISKRRQHHHVSRCGAILSQQARKVSFEEGSAHSSSSDSLKSSSQSSMTLIPRTSPCTNMFLMSSLLERETTPTTCLSEMDSSSDEEDSHDKIRSRTVSQEEQDSSYSPWGQFVDVIPEDYGCWSTPSSPFFPVLLHSSPAYHPYSAKQRKTTTATAGLSPIPNETSPTRKLQQRRMTEVEGALEQLRF